MTIFVGHSVNIHPDGAGSAVLLGGITQMSEDIQTEINSEEVAGSPYALNTTIKSQKPSMKFSTRDIKKAIDTFGLLGLTIAGATNPGLEMWKAFIEAGVTKSGSFHKKTRMPAGRAVIRKLMINHQDDAQADCEAMSTYDGTNLPFIPSAANQALPGTPADPARHTLYNVTFGGVAIPGVTSIDIDFGLTIDMISADSDIYDTYLLLSKIQPTLTIKTLRPGLFLTSSGVPLSGLAGTHANTKIQLRKRATGTTPFVADATTEHISITTAGILTIETAFNSSAFKRGEITYKITSRFDGTNTPLVFNTATAIT
jgi:hypothetical protein